MPTFDSGRPEHRAMRQRVLEVLLGIDKRVGYRHVSGPDGEFTIERTVNRKGYRHPMPSFSIADAGRYSEPMTRVSITFEVPDDVTPEFAALVADVREVEAVGAKAAAEAELLAAKDRARAAQAEVDRLEKELP